MCESQGIASPSGDVCISLAAIVRNTMFRVSRLEYRSHKNGGDDVEAVEDAHVVMRRLPSDAP